MIVPEYWTEARRTALQGKKRVTVRRFGWSDASEADAQEMAETRAAEALEAVLAGRESLRREPKVPYNGAKGVPIREQIVARHDDAVITRNAYGARCLNTPDIIFADVDDTKEGPAAPPWLIFAVLAALSLLGGRMTGSWLVAGLMLAASAAISMFLGNAIYDPGKSQKTGRRPGSASG